MFETQKPSWANDGENSIPKPKIEIIVKILKVVNNMIELHHSESEIFELFTFILNRKKSLEVGFLSEKQMASEFFKNSGRDSPIL